MEPEFINSPPRRSANLLTRWVQEYKEQGHLIAGDVRVAPQEDDDTSDTGLVIVTLRHANASVVIQATGYDQPLWEATLTAREADLTFAPHQLASRDAADHGRTRTDEPGGRRRCQ